MIFGKNFDYKWYRNYSLDFFKRLFMTLLLKGLQSCRPPNSHCPGIKPGLPDDYFSLFKFVLMFETFGYFLGTFDMLSWSTPIMLYKMEIVCLWKFVTVCILCWLILCILNFCDINLRWSKRLKVIKLNESPSSSSNRLLLRPITSLEASSALIQKTIKSVSVTIYECSIFLLC